MSTTNRDVKYIIVTDTICQGRIPGCWGDDDKPVIYDTKEDAYKELADFKIMELQQFIAGERSLEDTSFELEDSVVPVIVHDLTGLIKDVESGEVLFDPAHPEKYGR